MTKEASISVGDVVRNEIPCLPPGTEVISYLEGNANVLVELACPESSSSQLKQKYLLRLRKDKSSSSKSTWQAFHEFNAYIRPLFGPNDIVEQCLVRLFDDSIEQANELLRSDVHRCKKRRGTYVANDQYGILVENMNPSSPDDGHQHGFLVDFFEFKPKWLLQSPSAPKDAIRCRTCALREMRLHDGVVGRDHDRNRESHDSVIPPPEKSTLNARKINEQSLSYFCPLGLVSKDFNDVLRTARAICSSLPEKGRMNGSDMHRVDTLARIIYQHPLLLRLQALQAMYGEVSLKDFTSKPSQERLADSVRRGVSMTIRDCTVLLNIAYSNTSFQDVPDEGDINMAQRLGLGYASVKMKLCDLDFKDGSGGKVAYWRGIEERLINEGWYTGRKALSSLSTQHDDASSGRIRNPDVIPIVEVEDQCLLERTSSAQVIPPENVVRPGAQ